jgi:hypothetical protein
MAVNIAEPLSLNSPLTLNQETERQSRTGEAGQGAPDRGLIGPPLSDLTAVPVRNALDVS